ncbi:MAG TPA: hypothetical protein VN654_16380 [Vicinamibacterales bacterium]|jgi:hypothetical protein|nr:hypothetical protein [Vicinamibacterales bacterium]
MDHEGRDRDERPRDRLNYLRLELAQLRERFERVAAREGRRHADLPFKGVDRRKAAA